MNSSPAGLQKSHPFPNRAGGFALAVALLAATWGATAGNTAYSCRDTLGRTTLQDQPCGAGQDQRKSYAIPGSSQPAPAVGSAPASSPKPVSARAAKDAAYICAALADERAGVDQEIAKAAVVRAGYWRTQAQRLDTALCRRQCRPC